MSAAIDSQGVLETLEHADRLLVQQVFKPIANEYRISVPAPGSTEEGAPLLFVRQKRMKIREDIRFRLAPDDDAHLFMIKSKTVFEFRGRHEVLDADGRVIGMLEKSFGKSLLRSHWFVRGSAGEELLQAQETSLAIALLRRFAGMVSDELSMLQWLPFNFTLLRAGWDPELWAVLIHDSEEALAPSGAWPVWVLGYVMAILTYAQGVHTNIGESGVAVWMHPSRSLGVVYTIVVGNRAASACSPCPRAGPSPPRSAPAISCGRRW